MIRVRDLAKRFHVGADHVRALDNVGFGVESHSFFTLLGPSGCGKSTILRCVAGLETPDGGEIDLGDDCVFSSSRDINVPPHRRHIGMVFQSYAIWPHMTVSQNVAFPLEVQKQPNVRPRTMAALEATGLAALADRYASRLSGGQQQRVAFARAIVSEPRVLLLDEPLSNLDAALREQMCAELRRLHERLRITTLFVTHDQGEALSMSDRIAVMRDGRFVEVGTPEELWTRPRTVFTAQFLGGANVYPGDAEPNGQRRHRADSVRQAAHNTARQRSGLRVRASGERRAGRRRCGAQPLRWQGRLTAIPRRSARPRAPDRAVRDDDALQGTLRPAACGRSRLG